MTSSKRKNNLNLFYSSNSCPDLRFYSFDEFMHFWNKENKNNKKESLIFTCWPVKLMFFYRSKNEKQQNNNNNNQKRLAKQLTTKTINQQKTIINLNSQKYNLGGPLVSLRNQSQFVRSPFIPLSFERQVENQNFALRDEDLLPSCWFLSDSEMQDLNQRAHYKLQRRISRRRSLTKANFSFGETNPRRAKVVEKYHRLKVGVRRALSDHQILFMDPIKDVECELNSIFNLSTRYAINNKRVSFSSSSPVCASSIQPNIKEKIEANWNEKNKEQKQQIQSVKPILTRKNSVKTNRNTATLTPFRHRIGTSLSVGGCYEDENDYCSVIRPMDYAMFRAWRRGSRLSVDVAPCPSSFENSMGRNSQSEQKVPLTGWALVLKRVLADWIKRRKHSNNEIITVEEEVEKEINEDNNILKR